MSNHVVFSIILNMNRREDTLKCLSSLAQSTYQNKRTLVLDVNSNDGIADGIRADYPEVMMIELQTNQGYAGNNNIGIEYAIANGADWIYILNEDTIQSVDCIARLVEVGESDSKIGILGPMVYHADEPGVIQSAGGKMDRNFRTRHIGQNESDLGQYSQVHPVEWISGCGMLVRRSMIEQIGLLDVRYFLYNEEVEWCIRAREAGWKIMHVPQAKLWHKGVQRNYRPNPSVTYYSTRNQLLTLLIHHASLKAWFVNGFGLMRTLVSWTVRPEWRDKREHRNAMWHGIVDFFGHKWGKMTWS